jgi:hypothetical protein
VRKGVQLTHLYATAIIFKTMYRRQPFHSS